MNKDIRLVVGANVRKLRRSKNWSQQDLASKLGWERLAGGRKVSKIETTLQHPTEEDLASFAEVFGVSIEELSTSLEKEGLSQLTVSTDLLKPDIDLRPFFKKLADCPNPLSFTKAVGLLHCYCSLKSSGIEC